MLKLPVGVTESQNRLPLFVLIYKPPHLKCRFVWLQPIRLFICIHESLANLKAVLLGDWKNTTHTSYQNHK